MKIVLNGENVILDKETILTDFLSQKSINPNTIVIEYNTKIIPKSEFCNIILKDNDVLEVLSFVGGG